ncbi:8-oxo-dGTP diphosphatase [Mycetocola sp. BIGb0189]|uniref:NUDIX hydrolase n=1 Tax=Mycetocola sp. BIGb0189 TaxID=2940604 RepID=UPI002167291F|nr:NUDIX hydrolase [Mycetocola sp. BIGb0189]MCS4275480.1 8-oxo-dGTP diphosphatase [Mycetocola sp. BIGb0189]
MITSAPIELAVSTVIFALRPGDDSGRRTVWLPLVRRIREPQQGKWALPGGPLEPAQELSESAAFTLNETTGLSPSYLEQLYAFGNVGRSPGNRVVSIIYWALVREEEAAEAVVTENVRWFPADDLPELAFDHAEIVEYALGRLRGKLEYSNLGHAFVGELFTLSALREVYEAVLDKRIDPANFRRQVETSGLVRATEQVQTGGRHRPARLYRFTAPVGPSGPQVTRSL